jgi:DNA-binding transcriptional regulator LsrR (DeoR family)
MISREELRGLRDLGAVCDTLGVFIDAAGRLLPNRVTERALAIPFDLLRGRDVVLLAAGVEKVGATAALLRTGAVKGLIIDGDGASMLVGAADPKFGRGLLGADAS